MQYLFFLLLLLIACGEDDSLPCRTGFTVFEEAVQAAQCGQADGAVTLAASGGSGAVAYRINDSSPQASATFTNLLPGDYEVVAQDEAGCTAGLTIRVTEAVPQWTVATETTPASCNQPTGRITVQATGGAAPYQYRLDSASFRSESTFDNLLPGEYSIVAQDANGCTTTTSARVASSISFRETVHDIITTHCAITGCHVSGRDADFTVRDNIFEYAERIQERTGDRSMPLGRELTDEEITQIDCWVNDGAPDN